MKPYRICTLTAITTLSLHVALAAPNPNEITCLALNIYYEARSEPIEGQIAVAAVTLTRAKINKSTLCKTVYAPYQFSWTLAKALPPPSGKEWRNIQTLAKSLYKGRFKDPTHGATHYFATYIKTPPWNFNLLTFQIRIGHHLFYKQDDAHALSLTLAAL